MKKQLKRLLVLLIVCFITIVQAEDLLLAPYPGGVTYSFQAKDEYLIVKCKTSTQTVQQTVFSDHGVFSGDITLPNTFAASSLKVSVETLKGNILLTARAETVAVAQEIVIVDLPPETRCRKLTDVEITPLVHAMEYRFCAPGRDTVLLHYRNSTESGTVTLHAGADYIFSGVLVLAHTYDYSNVVLTVTDTRNNNELFETMLRTAVPPTPQAPPQGTGRLSGITVCIDPGHQANSMYVVEEIGPGLDGTKSTGSGMARGVVTKRLESIVVLEIGLRLRDVLLAEGATVVMTRDTQDTYVTNRDRARIAGDANADFMLRLHCNARDEGNSAGHWHLLPL